MMSSEGFLSVSIWRHLKDFITTSHTCEEGRLSIKDPDSSLVFSFLLILLRFRKKVKKTNNKTLLPTFTFLCRNQRKLPEIRTIVPFYHWKTREQDPARRRKLWMNRCQSRRFHETHRLSYCALGRHRPAQLPTLGPFFICPYHVARNAGNLIPYSEYALPSVVRTRKIRLKDKKIRR